MAVKFKLRRDWSYNWSAKNPVLADGEPGVERDTNKMKIGDGVSRWSLLSYQTSGTIPPDDDTSLVLLYENAKV